MQIKNMKRLTKKWAKDLKSNSQRNKCDLSKNFMKKCSTFLTLKMWKSKTQNSTFCCHTDGITKACYGWVRKRLTVGEQVTGCNIFVEHFGKMGWVSLISHAWDRSASDFRVFQIWSICLGFTAAHPQIPKSEIILRIISTQKFWISEHFGFQIFRCLTYNYHECKHMYSLNHGEEFMPRIHSQKHEDYRYKKGPCSMVCERKKMGKDHNVGVDFYNDGVSLWWNIMQSWKERAKLHPSY